MDLQNEAFADTPVELEESALCARVLDEFREMPGLQITLAQAARLFSLDLGRCERVLQGLVHGGALRTDGRLFALIDARPARRSRPTI
jgi:hypothetical protein